MMMTQSLTIWQITRFFNLPWFSVLLKGEEFLPIASSSLCKESFALPFALLFYGKWDNLVCSFYSYSTHNKVLPTLQKINVVPIPEVGLVAIGTLLIVVVVPTVHEKSYQKCIKLVLPRLQKYTLYTFLRLDMLPLENSWLSLLYLQSMEKSYQKYAKLILPRLQKHTLYTFLRSDMLSLENSWSLSL